MPDSLFLISDFNIEVLERTLAHAPHGQPLHVHHAPFGQVYQALGQAHPGGATTTAMVWTRPEGVIPGYARAAELAAVPADEILHEVDGFCDHLLRYADKVRCLFVTTWVAPVGARGYGMLDWRPGTGLAHLLARMNLRLAERLAERANTVLLDADRWLRAAGARGAMPKLWYASKVPYANQVFADAAADVRAALDGLAGRARKLLLLDLDNTLWGGVVGETGWQGVTLGGHDHVGEAFVDFQRACKSLSNRGVQLGIVSKNDEPVALEAIDRHPEMLLRRSDFAGWRINWTDKAKNISELVAELNLGLASVVFIDDNPAERGRIREALPEVLVPDWPEDPAQYRTALLALRCFDTASINDEDRDRTKMYVAERERRASQAGQPGDVGSTDDWLKTLDLKVTVEPLSDGNLARAAQLLNKTNQLNMSTRRMLEPELKAWVTGPGRRLWTFSVADRFGNSGLTGMCSIEIAGTEARIVDFLLSCRVMGRKVEQAMVHVAVAHAVAAGARTINAQFIPTERNGPCLAFWKEQSAFTAATDNLFTWDAACPYPLPEPITLVQSQP